MATTDETILMDVDEDWCGVLAAAARHHGQQVYDLVEGPDVPGCPRALASHRLAVRFFAAGQQNWHFRMALPFISDELERMGTPDARGCDLADCPICHPPRCRTCGGVTAQACGV